MNKKILLIDDDLLMVKMLSAYLEAQGFDVITACNGKEALGKVREDIAVIILDIVMPEIDGYQFYKIIKNDSRYSRIPIVVLTARVSMRTSFELLGADMFVPKPVDFKELLLILKDLMTKKILLITNNAALKVNVKGLTPFSCRLDCVDSAQEAYAKVSQSSYNMVAAHLSVVTEEPKEFLSRMRSSFKNKKTPVIIYCDSNVIGTEDGNTMAINSEETKWLRAKADGFYDSRITDEKFSDVINKYL